MIRVNLLLVGISEPSVLLEHIVIIGDDFSITIHERICGCVVVGHVDVITVVHGFLEFGEGVSLG